MLVNTKLEGRADTSSSLGEIKFWSKLWETEVPSNVKKIVCRLSQQSLPTMDLLKHRNMSSVLVCGLCVLDD